MADFLSVIFPRRFYGAPSSIDSPPPSQLISLFFRYNERFFERFVSRYHSQSADSSTKGTVRSKQLYFVVLCHVYLLKSSLVVERGYLGQAAAEEEMNARLRQSSLAHSSSAVGNILDANASSIPKDREHLILAFHSETVCYEAGRVSIMMM